MLRHARKLSVIEAAENTPLTELRARGIYNDASMIAMKLYEGTRQFCGPLLSRFVKAAMRSTMLGSGQLKQAVQARNSRQ